MTNTAVYCMTLFVTVHAVYPVPIIPIPWNADHHVLQFCIQPHGYDVDRNLVQTAFDSINSFLVPNINDIVHAPLYLQLMADVCSTVDYPYHLTYGTVSTSFGVTRRQFENRDRKLVYEGGNVTIDTGSLRSAASFYNVLLHELGHVVGLDHPRPRHPPSMMSYAVRTTRDGRVEQDDTYITIHSSDVDAIRRIVYRDFPQSYLPSPREIPRFVPQLDPTWHFSGKSRVVVTTRITPQHSYTPQQQQIPKPTGMPTGTPTGMPTGTPTGMPTGMPTEMPTRKPTEIPTQMPTGMPTGMPTRKRRGRRGRRGKIGNSRKITVGEERNERQYPQQQERWDITPVDRKVDIRTQASPELEVESEGTQVDIRSRASPEIDVEGNGQHDIGIATEASPSITVVGGSQHQINIQTDVSPIINLRNHATPALGEENWSPFDECFFC